MCVGVCLWCVNLASATFLIRVHFPPPNLIRSVRVAGLRGGWVRREGEELEGERGRIKSK